MTNRPGPSKWDSHDEAGTYGMHRINISEDIEIIS
jgi:hypothetical protein